MDFNTLTAISLGIATVAFLGLLNYAVLKIQTIGEGRPEPKLAQED